MLWPYGAVAVAGCLYIDGSIWLVKLVGEVGW